MNPFLAALLLLPSVVHRATTVSLDARGQDIRETLASLFGQAHKPFALDANIRGTLYMRFNGLPYDQALEIVTQQAGLVVQDKNGVVLVSLANPPKPEATLPKPETAAASKRPSPATILARRVTTNLSRAPLATVFASFGKQADVGISLDKVPAYRVDATFKSVPLRSALDQVCNATGLKYGFAGGKIVVSRR